jgi:hypothetical protein
VPLTAFLDANVLIPITLLTTAEAGLYRPLWTDAVLDEVRLHATILAARSPAPAPGWARCAARFLTRRFGAGKGWSPSTASRIPTIGTFWPVP